MAEIFAYHLQACFSHFIAAQINPCDAFNEQKTFDFLSTAFIYAIVL